MPRRLTAHQLGGSCAESDWRKQLVKIGRRRTSAAITVCEAKDVGCPPPEFGARPALWWHSAKDGPPPAPNLDEHPATDSGEHPGGQTVPA